MNSKYVTIGGIVILIIFIFGLGLYIYGNSSDNSETLGVQVANQAQVENTNTNGGESKFNSMKADEFKNAIESGEYTLIDIRTAEEYASGHIQGAEQNDFYQTQTFLDYLDSLDKNEKYLIYCRSGNRSGQALNIMQGKKFTNVADLAGGISAWTGAGLPVEH